MKVTRSFRSINKILLPWALVVFSFLLASVWLKERDFYLFGIIWRVSIILGVYLFGRIRPAFSLKQGLVLVLVFVLNFVLVRVFSSFHPLSYVVQCVVLAPLSEEMFFRGWLISKINGSKKDKVVWSSLFFSLYHLKNWFCLTPVALIYQLLYTGLVAGPIFAWVRLKYDSLFPSIALHSVNNMISLTITERLFPFIVGKNG